MDVDRFVELFEAGDHALDDHKRQLSRSVTRPRREPVDLGLWRRVGAVRLDQGSESRRQGGVARRRISSHPVSRALTLLRGLSGTHSTHGRCPLHLVAQIGWRRWAKNSLDLPKALV